MQRALPGFPGEGRVQGEAHDGVPPRPAQTPLLQQFCEAHVSNPGNVQSSPLPHIHETLAIAFLGATSEATTGIATIDARPIFLITSRRLCPANFDVALSCR